MKLKKIYIYIFLSRNLYTNGNPYYIIYKKTKNLKLKRNKKILLKTYKQVNSIRIIFFLFFNSLLF